MSSQSDAQFFERSYVVTLDRRPDRYERFVAGLPADWPFPRPAKFRAIDGQIVKPPRWWRPGDGAWGCYRSHVAILEACLNEGCESVLLFEDDAIFPPDFTARALEFLAAVPLDWQMLYLGGQLLKTSANRPGRVSDLVYRPHNVNRTHAFAVRGRDFMAILYRHLHDWNDWKPGHHIDHHFGRLHEGGKHAVYCPCDWLVGQAEGVSDIKRGNVSFPDRFWPAPRTAAGHRPPPAGPFTAIVGLHSSGSSALAGLIYHLGAYMGGNLGGFYGNDPATSCGFEAAKLARICEMASPFPSCERCLPSDLVAQQLRSWTNRLRAEAARLKTAAVGKYPLLCRLGDELHAALGDELRVIHIDRPLEESIESLARRCPNRDPAVLEDHQRWLWEGKQALLESMRTERVFSTTYEELLADPAGVAICALDFLGMKGTPARLGRAVAYVDAGKRHVAPLGK